MKGQQRTPMVPDLCSDIAYQSSYDAPFAFGWVVGWLVVGVTLIFDLKGHGQYGIVGGYE